MDINEPCPHCGCVKPFHDNIERAMNAKFELGQRFRQLHAQHAGDLAYKELQLIEAQEGMKWMQTKVRKQAAVIRKLEEKIRQLGNQPYAELLPTVPVVLTGQDQLEAYMQLIEHERERRPSEAKLVDEIIKLRQNPVHNHDWKAISGSLDGSFQECTVCGQRRVCKHGRPECECV